jgi:hypothetical protein
MEVADKYKIDSGEGGLRDWQDLKRYFVEKLCDAIVENMGREELEMVVWDHIYGEMNSQPWVDLMMMAEDYGISPEIAA